MPEGPEVYRLVKGISDHIGLNNTITDLEILSGRYQTHGMDNYDTFKENLPLKILEIGKKGKFCWFRLEKDWTIWITFGMSGGFALETSKHARLKITLADHKIFYWRDMRNFGTWKLVPNSESLQQKLDKLGHDILSDSPLTESQILELFKRYEQKNICQFLMSQTIFSGVGNYLKSESLYASKINPYTQVKDIPPKSRLLLYECLRRISQDSYDRFGMSIRDYERETGEKGEFQNFLKVYCQNKDPDGNEVIRVTDTPDKRTTYYVKERSACPP